MHYVIIGNSAAAVGAVEGIRRVDTTGEITIVSSEPYHTYSRPLISYFLKGKVDREHMQYRASDFYETNNIELLSGVAATKVDPQSRQVTLADGRTINYDKLLVATGSSPFTPEYVGLETVAQKFNFNSFDDALAIDQALSATPNPRVLIVGAGLVGLKCAEGIIGRAAKVTVVNRSAQILSSILDAESAKIVQAHIAAAGVQFMLGYNVTRFTANSALLDDGSELTFDLLILALGTRPNTELLAGIAEIDRGILINERSETTATDIFAAGDCTQTLDISSGQSIVMAILPNAYMQGECAGLNMAEAECVFDQTIPMNAIGFFGLNIITAGSYVGESFLYREQPAGAPENYKRLFYSDNRLKGYILVGNVDKAGIYTNLIRECTPLDSLDFDLVVESPGLMAFTREDRQEILAGKATDTTTGSTGSGGRAK